MRIHKWFHVVEGEEEADLEAFRTGYQETENDIIVDRQKEVKKLEQTELGRKMAQFWSGVKFELLAGRASEGTHQKAFANVQWKPGREMRRGDLDSGSTSVELRWKTLWVCNTEDWETRGQGKRRSKISVPQAPLSSIVHSCMLTRLLPAHLGRKMLPTVTLFQSQVNPMGLI